MMQTDLDRSRMPVHIAIVMDGNGRWAKQRNLPRLAGHNAGMQALKEIVKRSSALGIKHLTVYAFSTENWKRPEEEISGIFRILVAYVNKELEEIHANNVRVTILGEYEKFPENVVAKLRQAMGKTENNTGLEFHIALNYGGRPEILRAARALCRKAKAGTLDPEAVTEEVFQAELFTAGLPDPDLIVRTSGEMRLSNYLLWQSAYSEFVFTDVLWPDFTPDCLEDAIREYQGRSRRFGGIK
ncbi:MAG: isoprenyl transferase [Firmicutes bacterium]|nr:isoprenyl transferase [Bacillota bacterium]